ncbi:hypothetical protein SAMN02745857_03939 [Andreprevotia lacus DSM 23236]|jgi:uncharacterized protein YigA (DUF484 family)|uniref:DUF484 family protein n=1 Tax=Andreprevotia lacus DSM 23236 TaxID=1121001 RepID=A0A1W1Y0C3_9NEIS|nr:DUF484 family protein [Andreprevotia lacus]SMC29582.1 hypothetical protein SAMN02745857_03939 [Andreprevotia lacus DSM 23236]
MQAHDILGWLRDNPAFFDEYADDVAEIYVPHSHRGQAISLAERQLLTLRDKNRALELRLGELLQFGEENDLISERLHRLAVDLMQAGDLAGIVGTLEFHLKERFQVPQVAMRLWLQSESNLREFAPVGDAVRKLSANLVSPYCGPYVTDEVHGWFDDPEHNLKSFAQFALRTGEEPFGLLVMASDDVERFYPDMGTLYLQRLADLVSAAIRRVTPAAVEAAVERAAAFDGDEA